MDITSFFGTFLYYLVFTRVSLVFTTIIESNVFILKYCNEDNSNHQQQQQKICSCILFKNNIV